MLLGSNPLYPPCRIDIRMLPYDPLTRSRSSPPDNGVGGGKLPYGATFHVAAVRNISDARLSCKLSKFPNPTFIEAKMPLCLNHKQFHTKSMTRLILWNDFTNVPFSVHFRMSPICIAQEGEAAVRPV